MALYPVFLEGCIVWGRLLMFPVKHLESIRLKPKNYHKKSFYNIQKNAWTNQKWDYFSYSSRLDMRRRMDWCMCYCTPKNTKAIQCWPNIWETMCLWKIFQIQIKLFSSSIIEIFGFKINIFIPFGCTRKAKVLFPAGTFII